jgi:predicted transcriptional regulator
MKYSISFYSSRKKIPCQKLNEFNACMIISQFIQTQYPVVRLTDSAQQVIDWMDEVSVNQLPVAEEGVYIGLVDKELLEDVSPVATMSDLRQALSMFFCRENDFITIALQQMAAHSLTLLPVVQDGNLSGVVTATEMLKVLSVWLGAAEKQGIIVIESTPDRFSLGEINRLIETNDLVIHHLNTRYDAGQLIATIRVNRPDIQAAVSALQRYGYTVLYQWGSGDENQELQDNYQHLLSYLNL